MCSIQVTQKAKLYNYTLIFFKLYVSSQYPTQNTLNLIFELFGVYRTINTKNEKTHPNSLLLLVLNELFKSWLISTHLFKFVTDVLSRKE